MDNFVERVFPLRVSIEEPRPGHQITPEGMSQLSVDIEAPKCHTKRRSKFDGPKVWGDQTAKAAFKTSNLAHLVNEIQSLGALAALRKSESGFNALAVSDNITAITHLSLEDVFSASCFSKVISDDREAFKSCLQFVLENASHPHAPNLPDPEVFPVSIKSSTGQVSKFWCSVHATLLDSNILVCEFEKYIPSLEPRLTKRTKIRKPTKRLNYNPTEAEYKNATTRKSYPLRHRRGENSDSEGRIDAIALLNQIQRQCTNTTSIPQLYDVAVGTVSEITNFDRVMVYRFDECKCGAVVGEMLNPEASKDVFLGLHFPSSDVPVPIRELHKLDRVQLLREKLSPVSSIVDREGAKFPLDLSRCYLRAFPPEQVEYFSRMQVTSAMSISIIVNHELWGLVMCHSYDAEITVVSPPLKELCRAIGGLLSTHIERLLSKEKVELRSSLMAGLSLKSPAEFLAADTANLLQVFGAEFGILTLNGEARSLGKLEAYQEALALLHYFCLKKPQKVISSQKIATDFPDLEYQPGFKVLAGVLVIPLSDSGADFLTMFRKGQLLEIFWAGNEQEQFQYVGGVVPEPTAGLLRWVEHITDTSREWTDDQMDIATVIGLLYGTFIKTWRQKEAIEESSRVKKLLISNASHEIRTPLNSIINYLEVILDGNVDEITREQLGKSLTASKSLIFAINDLLDLTRANGTNQMLLAETFDLQHEIHSVVEAFAQEAFRKDLILQANLQCERLPTLVRGDPARLRQAISNVLSNAIQNTVVGKVTVSLGVVDERDGHVVVEVAVEDQGKGMSEAQLDSCFQSLENIAHDSEQSNERQAEVDFVGLGLAVVARYVRNYKGQLRIRSKPEHGTTVYLRMTMDVSPAHQVSVLETPSSDQAMADLLQNIEERAADIDKCLMEVSEIREIQTPVTDITPSEYISSPLSMQSQASVIGSGDDFQNSRGFPFPSMVDFHAALASLRILVAEDNPLNAKILNLRLSKMGHEVSITTDGQACADTFASRPDEFDVILMDLQMPIIDGHGSTRLIRDFEYTSPKLSEKAALLGRIPIFAVSASLLEDLCDEYMATGFDGWIMKPIDFKRLGLLMNGIYDNDIRDSCLYKRGYFESGGWFKGVQA